jgi:hypothetical protein
LLSDHQERLDARLNELFRGAQRSDWADLGFPGHAHDDFNRQVSGRPFANFPNVVVDVDANLSIKEHAQLNYQSTIIQSGAALEIAKWSGPGTRTALDVLGGARYWNPDLNLSVNLKGSLNVDVTAEATFDLRDVLRTVRNRGFHLNRRGAKLLEREAAARSAPGQDITFERTVQIEVEKAVALAASNDMEWVDPFVGFRLRHAMGPSKELSLEGDGFGAGSDFSWQIVSTYGFDTSLCGTPFHAVLGYRALAVDFSGNGKFGRTGSTSCSTDRLWV